jgi:hypothetical protein
MRRFPKFLVIALTLLPLLSFAEPTGWSQEPKPQKENTSAAAPRLAGHYEGTATNKEQQAIPLIVNLTDDNGRFSGQVNSNYGVYPITGELEVAIRSPSNLTQVAIRVRFQQS